MFNIGLSTNTLVSKQAITEIDGIGAYTLGLMEGLRGLGHRVIAVYDPHLKLSLYQSPSLNRTLFTHEKDVYTHSSIEEMSFTLPFEISSLLSTVTGLRTIGQNRVSKAVDVFHCTDYRQPVFRKLPLVTTLHDAIFLQQPDLCRKQLRDLKNYVIRHLARRATKIICISHAAKIDIINYFGIPEEKMSVIHHGVDPYWLKKIEENDAKFCLQKFKLKPGFLLFSGTIQPRKNINRLLQAYQQLPLDLQSEFPLVLAGKAGWDESALAALRSLSGKKNIKWLGYVTRNELRCLYQNSQAFVFPSLSEGFGLPILEAFASGTAVISSNCSALPEVCGDAALLVDPTDVDNLSHSIQVLLTSPNLRLNLIERGTERLKQFSMQTCLDKTVAVYQSVIEK